MATGHGMVLAMTAAILAAPATAATVGGMPGTELARCATIAASQARLACYDALAGRAPDEARSAAGLGAASAAAVAVAPQPAAAAAPADPVQTFGLPEARLQTAPKELPAIEAHVAQVHVDQYRRGSVVLDNGQVWALTEGENWLGVGEAVTIRRAALGSFMLTSASKYSYRVRRVR